MFIHVPAKIDLGTTSVPTLKSFPLRLFSWAIAQPRLLIAMRPAGAVASLMSTVGWEGLEPVALN